MKRLTVSVILLTITWSIVTAATYTEPTSTTFTAGGYTQTVFYSHGFNYAAPRMADFDGDGDGDLVIGHGDDYLSFVRNDGTAAMFSAGQLVLHLVDIPGQSQLVPYPGDLDGDGDIDLIVGSASGAVYFVENTGIVNGIPQFALHSTPILTHMLESKPALDDADGDGDLDLFIGASGGTIAFYQNVGSKAAYSFVLVSDNIIDTTSILKLMPAFADIDGDGDSEMICGNKNNTLVEYDKIVNGNSFSYQRVTSTYGSITLDQFTSCFLFDIDNDGDFDILASDLTGAIRLYEESLVAAPTLLTGSLAVTDFQNASSVLIQDFNGDGYPDLLVAHDKTISYYTNDGNDPNNPHWTLVNSAIATTTYGNILMTGWDYDMDGDTDVFFGCYGGGVGLLKNVGTPTAPAFSQLYTGYRYTLTQSFENMRTEYPNSTVLFIDVDGDGDRDAIIGSVYGYSAFYRNDNIDINQGGSDDILDPWSAGDFVLVQNGGNLAASYFPDTLGRNPSLAVFDPDGDGDYDVLFGNVGTGIGLYRNNGTPDNAAFTVETRSYAGIQFDPDAEGTVSDPVDTTIGLGDINGDGWTDIVLGGAKGGLRLYIDTAGPDTTPPPAPSGFTAVASRHDRVKLQWNRVTEPGGTGIGAYQIKRDGVLIATVETPCPTTYLDTGLNQTTTYNYEVIAVDRAGNPSAAATASATTGLPPQLDHFEFVEPTGLQDATFDLTIRAIDNYGYLYDSFNNAVTLTPSSGSISPTSASLVNGTATVTLTYTDPAPAGEILLTITADYSGTSSDTGQIHLDIMTPDTPDLTGALVIDEHTVQLVWSNVFDYGGSPNYYIDIYRNGVKIHTVDGAEITWTDTSALPETTYTYKLKSRDAVGNTSPFSNEKTVTTPAPAIDEEAPSIPQNLRQISVGKDYASIQWDPSSDTGGSGLYGYEVFRGGTMVGTTTNTVYSDSGLTPDTSYTYFVRSVDNAGNRSNFSDGLTIKTQKDTSVDNTPPSTPSSFTGSAPNDTTVHLTWGASSDTGGSGLSGYQVFRSDYGAYVTVFAFVSAPATFFDDTTVRPGRTYTYKIRAVDHAGNYSNYTADVSVTTPDSNNDTTPPSAPDNLAGTALTAQQIQLTWDPATDNVAVASYEVRQQVRQGFGYIYPLVATVTHPTTTLTFDHDGYDNPFTPATTYTFVVRAVDTSGNTGNYSQPADVTTPDVQNDETPPTPPTGLMFTAVRSTYVTLTWTASTDTESGVKQYHVFRGGSEIGVTASTEFTDSNVSVGNSYTWHVTAEDYAGNLSDPSTSVTTTIPDEDTTPPTTPSGLTASATPDMVTLSWNMSVDDGSGVNYYEIQKTVLNTPFVTKTAKAAATVFTTPFTSFEDEDVEPGTSYQYKVRAFDRAGNASSFTYTYVDVPETIQTDHTIYFPHIAANTTYWWTGFAVVNTSSQPANVSFDFFDSDGNFLTSLADPTTLAAGEKMVSTIYDLFNGEVPEGAAWWRIASDQRLDGFELFGTTNAEEMVGVKIARVSGNQLFFPSVMVDETYWTGIAIINLGDDTATLTFRAYDAAGNEVGVSPTHTIPSHGKVVDLAENFFEGGALPAGTTVLKAVTSQPAIGFALFGYLDHTGLAGLSALPLDPDTVFKSNKTAAVKGAGAKGADAPQNLAATVLSGTSVELTWDPPTTGTPDSYRMYTADVQHTPFGDRVVLGDLMGETTGLSLIVDGLTPDTEYTFIGVAVTGGVESSFSNDVTVTTDAQTTEEIFLYMAPRIEELNGGSTDIVMVNMADTSASVDLSTIDADGDIVQTVSLTIPARGKAVRTVGSSFTVSQDLVAVRATSNQPLTVYEVFSNSESGYYDTLYAFSSGLETVNFTHIANNTQYWNSDIAIWNLSEYSNLVTLKVYDADGGLLTTETVTIPALGVAAGEIHSFIPDDNIVQQIGWIEVVGQFPVNGYLAFGPKNGLTLAAIEGN